MNNVLAALIALALLLPVPAGAQQEEAYDYWRFNRDMTRYWQQAILMCNGLFMMTHRHDGQEFIVAQIADRHHPGSLVALRFP